MKKKFWNVQIEVYTDGRVLAAVLGTRTAAVMPRDVYIHNPGREVYSLWFDSEPEAGGAVLEALAMNEKRGKAA